MRRDNSLGKIDWITVILYVLLACIGLAFIYATTYSPINPSFFRFNTSYGKQFIFFGLSLFVAIVILILDSKFYTSFAYILYGLIMLLLVGVLLFGVEIKGSKSWFKFGAIAFQPAELAKFATVLGLAKYLSSYNINLEKLKDKFTAAAILFLPIGLILLQGDVGSMLVFSSLVFLLHREGLESSFLVIGFGLIFFSVMALLFSSYVLIMSYAFVLILIFFYNRKDAYPILKLIYWSLFFIIINVIFSKFIIPILPENFTFPYIILALLFTIILCVGFFLNRSSKPLIKLLIGVFFAVSFYTLSVNYLFNNILKEHHRNRINIILGKIHDPSNVGYNLEQSKIAISSGGFFGKGYLKGTQTMLNYVPEQSTDFIFTSVAEEFGFVGSFFLITIYVAFLLRLIFLAERQRSQFSRVYGYGVVSIFFIHFAINIAMTIGLAPVIGIPLPFLSYGGSSLLSFTILLFVFIRLDTQNMLILR
ncbi:MAG: rod shape-determining protein RodA [Chitinophagales bacterium]